MTRKVQTAVDLRKMRRTFFQGIDELRVGETESTFLRRALTLYVWVLTRHVVAFRGAGVGAL